MNATDIADLRRQLVDSCHILAGTGNVREIVGHVSVRLPGTNEMLVRCRRPDDPGVEYTTVADIKRVDFDGNSSELTGGYILQGEFPIHSEIYRARPDVGAVVHGHPRASLLCGMLDLPFRNIVGAYDPGMLEIAVEPVPVFPRSVLINTPELGRQVVETMGSSLVCLLRGHGVITVGVDVPDATIRAIKLETIAEVTVQAHGTGRVPKTLSDEDVRISMAAWKPHSHVYTKWTWNFYRRKLGLM
jgi:ribulose-5-phosphate 4-epimerase/fuculose-1-phosphate aldolase